MCGQVYTYMHKIAPANGVYIINIRPKHITSIMYYCIKCMQVPMFTFFGVITRTANYCSFVLLRWYHWYHFQWLKLLWQVVFISHTSWPSINHPHNYVQCIFACINHCYNCVMKSQPKFQWCARLQYMDGEKAKRKIKITADFYCKIKVHIYLKEWIVIEINANVVYLFQRKII